MRFVRSLRLRTKFLLLVGVFALALAAAQGLSAVAMRDRMVSDRVAKLRSLVEVAHSTAQALEAEVKAGTLIREQALDRFRAAIYGMRYDGGEYLFAQTFDGIMVAHGAQVSLQGKDMTGTTDVNGHPIFPNQLAAARAGEGTTEYWYARAAGGAAAPKRTYVKAFTPWNMYVATGVYIDDINADFRAYLMRTGAVLLGVLLLGGGLALVLAGDVTTSMRKLRERLEQLAAGDDTSPVALTERRDETGAMARALEVVRGIAAEAGRLRAAQDETKRQAEAERTAVLAALADDMQASVGQAVETVRQQAQGLQDAAGRLAESAEGAKTGVDVAASGAANASGNVQAVAAAAEELSASVDEITRRVEESARVAGEAAAQVKKTEAMVTELNAAAAQIGAVVALIRQIAGQTNLLALNATIEAARAGEAGRGFAVVAGEVKGLAAQTGHATEEIGGQITRIQEATMQAVDAIGGIAAIVEQVNVLSAAIAAAVEQQDTATRDIAGSVARAAEATGAVSTSVGGLRGVADSVQGTAGTLLGAAGSLTDTARGLHERITGFLGTMRDKRAA